MGRDRVWQQLKAKGSGAAAQVGQYACLIFLFVVILALIDILLTSGQHGVDQASQFMRCCRDCFGLVHATGQATEIGAQCRLAFSQTACGHFECLGNAVGTALGFTRQLLAAGNFGARAQTQPGAEMLDRFELVQVRSDFGDDLQCRLTNRAPLEPPNRGLMEPAKGSEFQDSDCVIFSRFSLI